jgi:hypothetical protein
VSQRASLSSPFEPQLPASAASIAPDDPELFQLGAGYVVLSRLDRLARFVPRAFDVSGRVVTAIVDAPRLSEEAVIERSRMLVGRPLDRLVLTRKRPAGSDPASAEADAAASVRDALALTADGETVHSEVAPDIGGALFKASASMADDEVLLVFTDAVREARRHLLALGGRPISSIDDQPKSVRRPEAWMLGEALRHAS